MLTRYAGVQGLLYTLIYTEWIPARGRYDVVLGLVVCGYRREAGMTVGVGFVIYGYRIKSGMTVGVGFRYLWIQA